MVTGASFQKFSSDSARAFFVSLLKEEDAEDFNFILLGLSAAVKVINSQKRRVNTEKLRELSLEVYLRIVERFPWAVISPSIHRILAHAHEVIDLNEGFGLGNMVPGKTAPPITSVTLTITSGTGAGPPSWRWRGRSRRRSP